MTDAHSVGARAIAVDTAREKGNQQMNNTVERIIRDLIKARQEREAINSKYEELEERVKAYLKDAVEKTVTVDGHTVTYVEAKRRSFDADALSKLVSASVFKKVTEPTVKTKMLDAAVAMGTIDNEVLEKITSITEYTQLKVK